MIIFQPRLHRWQRVDYRRWRPWECVPSPVWTAVRETLAPRHMQTHASVCLSLLFSLSVGHLFMCVRLLQSCLVLMGKIIMFILCLTLCCCLHKSISDFFINNQMLTNFYGCNSCCFFFFFLKANILLGCFFYFFFILLVLFPHLLLCLYCTDRQNYLKRVLL